MYICIEIKLRMISTNKFNCSRKGLYRRPNFKPQLWNWSLLLYWYDRSLNNVSMRLNSLDCWCNVTGHSMEPEINHGDIIALKKIEDKSFLPLGEVYAIVTTNDMRTIKRLGAGKTDDSYTLIPSNKSPEYSPQQLPARMIRTIFQVLGAVKRF